MDGIIDIFRSGVNDETNVDYTFYLTGDLCQMSAQKRFLIDRGISVQQNNVYPCVRECDKKKALQMIWDSKCEGYHHYDKEYVELGICTKDEFWEYLRR